MINKSITEQENRDNSWQKSLNDRQADAVRQIEGPLLVLAGAGTGKTKVLTSRIAQILSTGTFPSQILAVTFTNKAAREMGNRIAALTENRSGGLWLGTFHSIAARILRRHAEVVGLKSNFTIIDTSDQLRLIKQIFADYNLDEKRWDPKILMHYFGRWKDRGLTPETVTAADLPDFAGGKSLELYKEYQKRLRSLNAADFGDLLLHNLTIFQTHPDILADYQRQFRYILVDEYQDTNVSQYLWLRLLAQKHKNICCVGDDDQSIYGWRGAEVGNILRFERDFPGAKVVRLEQNYRSTSHILSAASGIIAKNAGRLGKTLWTQGNDGEPIKVISTWDDKEEARKVADDIESLQQLHRHSLNDIAILVRAGWQTRSFEECFIQRSIPYKVIGGLRFYERLEIRDAIAYLRIIAQSDDSLAFERIVNTPKRGVGPTTLQAIYGISRDNDVSLLMAVRMMLKAGDLKPKIAHTFEQLLADIDRWHAMSKELTLAELTATVLKESGYLAMWKADASLEAQGRLENLKELLHALEEFETLEEFLEHVSLVSDIDTLQQDNMVHIMTLHAAKGLEFETVFLPGWEEGVFPNQRAVDESAQSGLEEERRLAYVGITRAKKRLTILCAASRRIFGQYQSTVPSRFISELPEQNIERILLNNPFASSGLSHASKYDSDEDSLPEFKPKASPAPRTPKKSPEGFGLMERVFHVKFGYGKIININGDQLDISFERAGIKKIVDRYVERAAE